MKVVEYLGLVSQPIKMANCRSLFFCEEQNADPMEFHRLEAEIFMALKLIMRNSTLRLPLPRRRIAHHGNYGKILSGKFQTVL